MVNMSKKNKKNFQSNIYISMISIYLVLYIIGQANFSNRQSQLFVRVSNILNAIIFISVIGLFIYIILDINKRKLLYLIIGVPIIIGVYFYSHKSLLIPYLFIYEYPSELNLKKLSKILYRCMFVSMCMILILYYLNFLQDVSIVQHGVLRHSLGFVTAQTYGNDILLLFFLKLYSSWNSWNIRDTLIWIFIISYSYLAANSRAALYLSVVSMIMIIIYRANLFPKWIQQITYYIHVIAFTICMSLSIFYMIYFSDFQTNLYNSLNSFTNGRLYYMITFYNQYGIHILGAPLMTISASMAQSSNGFLQWMGLDNSYAYIIINYGVITLIAYWVMYWYSTIKIKNEKNFGGAIYLIAFAFLGLTENYMQVPALNFSLLIFGSYLSQGVSIWNNSKENIKNETI